MAFVTAAIEVSKLSTSGCRTERRRFCSFTSILLPFVHLLLELPRLFLVHEGQRGHTLLELEGVEKGSVLVVLEWIVDLLIPYHAAVSRRNVDQFDPEGISDEVVGEHSCSLEACVDPSVPVWQCDVQSCDGNSLDLVGSFGHEALDSFLVVVREHGWHVACKEGRTKEV